MTYLCLHIPASWPIGPDTNKQTMIRSQEVQRKEERQLCL